MSDYRIEILPTHNEVTLSGRIDRSLMVAILGDLAETRDFPHRNAIWIIEDTVEPPSLDEIEILAAEVQRVLPSNLVDKRVGLVVRRRKVTGMLELWRSAATNLPFRLEIFQDYENAVHWIT